MSLPRIGLSLLIVTVFLLQVTGVYHLPFVEHLEDQLYDTRLKITMPRTQDPRVVIVDVDEKSLAIEGHWPWPRDRLALLVGNLFDYYQIGILGFDVVFAERDESSGLKVLDGMAVNELSQNSQFLATLEKIRPSLERDQAFAESLKARSVILGYYFQPSGPKEDHGTTGAGVLPLPVISLDNPDFRHIGFVEARGYGANLPVLQGNALGGGYFDNPQVDPDGVYRRVPLVQAYEGHLYESLSLAVTRALLGSPPVELVIEYEESQTTTPALEWLKVNGLRIPVDERGAALVPYRGPQGSFPYVSAADVLSRHAAREVLEGAIVLVGTTAPGLQDLRSTPVQNVYPGVEIHANLISGFLDQTVKHKPGYTVGIEFVELLVIGMLLSLFLPRLSALWSLVTILAILSVAVGTNLYAWQEANIVVPLASPVLLTVTLFIVHMSYGFFVEGRTRRYLTKMFGQYIPPELVDEMSKKSADFGLDGDSREMTVLFSDVRNFTTISEGLPPRAITQLMNGILTPMTEIIHKYRGTIDKYMGDATMAFWGAPLVDEDHARHALDAAIEMIEAIPGIQESFEARGWPPVRIGVGLNTGIMNVGNMGSEFRMAYTVLGDAVNLGSRLEGLTKQYGVSIIVSEFVKEKAPGFAFRELDRVRVKGKGEPVTIYEPLGRTESVDEMTQEGLMAYHEALGHYRTQAWDRAYAEFNDLHKQAPNRLLYNIYKERIVHFRANPPGADWDGVFVHTTK
jgi:adenylate cyclase